MQRIYLFQTIILLIIDLAQACPYKKKNQNLLSQENFYQTIQVQRNNSEEFANFYFGFYFWIEDDHFLTPKVNYEFQNPFLYEEEVNGNLILTIEVENEIKFVVYQDEGKIIINDLEKMRLDDYDGLPNIWTLFLFVINPIEGILIFQRTEWEYQIYQLSLNLKITKIALGGLQNINGINLDVYHGRLTKLETLEYFRFDQQSYSHLLASCFLPEKFVLDFGVYKFPENNCSVSQYMCGECYQGKCLSCDKDLEEYQYFAQLNYCLCSPESTARLFLLNDIQLAACFSEIKYRTDITLIEEEITLSSSNCMFGYFDVQKNDNNFCLQCPFQTSKSVGCVECILNQNIWYKEPICKSDFIAINEDLNSTYKFYDRKQIEYDAYIIDDLNQLVHLFGISQFCSNNQQENCFQLKKKHLNQIVFVQCKANLIQTEDACSVYDINCLEYSKNECQLCNIGSYLFNGKCLKCSTNCLTCLFNEETQSTFCTTCIENFAILNNACQKCGQFCMQCASEYDKQNNEFFLRCQRCVSDSKFFLAFDGINCLLNQISNCLYAFQALKDNISISTLDYQFQRQLNITNIVTLCSRCSDYHIFIFSEKQCLNLENKNCIFGFADTFEYGNQQETIQPNIKCVISNQSVSKCSQIQNCDVCLYRESFSQYFCLKCAQGYYFNTFSNQCYFYHQNCILSLRQNKYTKDSWKHMVQPFYHEFIEVPYNHSYTRYAQSLDENDYEAVCQTWMLPVDQICTKISSCSKCDNQDKQICVDCITDNYKAWTLENQQCIMCTTQCTVCKSRLIENMLKLNPYYDIIEQIEFNQRMAQICLRPSKQIDYYDWEINQFIQCNKYKSGCKKTLIVKRVLGCDFQMVSNRFTDDLYDLYDLIENERVKKIVLVYQSIKSQTCDLYDMIIGQIFSQRLFFILQAELEINCLHKIIWNVEGKIQFDKFTKISINGLIVRTMQNAIQSQFVFQSLNNQQIQFSNVIFDNQAEGKVDFQLCFFNATIISFINSTFSSFKLEQGRSFIKILPVNSNKTISLIQTNFFDFQLVDAEILNINNNKNDKIVLKNLLINGFFFNSSIIFSESFNRQGEIYIENITIQQSLIQNSKRFFALFSFTYLYINNFTIFKVNFTNTSFLWLAEQNFIQNINISNCHLDFKVCIIKNTADYQIQNTNFRNIVFAQNIYSIFSKFLKISKYDSISSEFSLKELYLKDNTLNELNLDINLKEPTHSLIFIESDIVSCNDIFIERTFGLNEFTFYNTYTLNLSSVQIVQGAFYQNKGLHQNLECFLQTCKTRLNGISILIYSAQYVSIHELILQNVYGVDYPIIHYLSESDAVQLKKETLILSSINFFGGISIKHFLSLSQILY